jgi:hypothetical protein
MKKLCTIMLISALLLLQGNRWTAYMSCRLKLIYSATVCDCERILSAPDNMPADHQNSSQMAHWQPDDFFCAAQTPSFQITRQATLCSIAPFGKDVPGFPAPCFKPPAG